VVLDGINAACSLHGWPHEKPEGVGAYRLTFEKPATRLGAAVLSLGHPVKDRTRQTERHGYGSGDWLNLVDGVGFRLEATPRPIRKGRTGASRLYSVKDRHGGVEQHGTLNGAREAGWWFLGLFQLSPAPLHNGVDAVLLAPAKDQDHDQTGDELDELADAIVAYLEKHGGRYESQRSLLDGLRASDVTASNDDIGPALVRLEDAGRIKREPEQGRRPRPGWLTDHGPADGAPEHGS
jgi:hypothetical protein